MELYSTRDICRRVAEAARAAHLRQDLSRATLAKCAGVSQASLIRFERTGEISLESLVNIAIALEAETEFSACSPFPTFPPSTNSSPRAKSACAGGSEAAKPFTALRSFVVELNVFAGQRIYQKTEGARLQASD